MSNQHFDQRVQQWESWIVGNLNHITHHNVETLVTNKFKSLVGRMTETEKKALEVAEENVLKMIARATAR